ncbi:UDP-N-acetylmuramoyl-L-alanine--D-glutamate ligase [Endozoicomonas sp.]|uniref:UDP-N-acetylmuramoyl-L-alanine--D-glutamate ligase n=1 Tax=Endozoicomonas sp. TaxID=1892382 RepID=UPI00383B6DD5
MNNSVNSQELIGSSCNRVIIGLGKTGLSCARYLYSQGLPFKIIDTRENPPGEEECRQKFPDVPLHTGGFNESWLMAADELVVSPGIALAEPVIANAIENGATAIGDIELFCRAVNRESPQKPVVAITGSNGKSTVTTLVGEMVARAGLIPGVGGNIGTPVLELLGDDTIDVYVLELSSFQLETTYSLRATAATVLNLSPDHMDRYPTLADYHQAKQGIYRGCATAVFNRDDPLTSPLLPVTAGAITFTSGFPDLGQMGLLSDDDGIWLSKGLEKQINTRQMKLRGRHNYLNALAALALGEAIGLDVEAMHDAIKDFPGLKHRCQWLGEYEGVAWFNDSKATNVGAAIAAIEGLGEGLEGRIVLIAGGDGKGADFTDLKPAIDRYVSHLVLIGRDGPAIEQAVEGSAEIHKASSLEDAVSLAAELAEKGDVVLLAPACASFDMFNSFEHRGDRFAELVNGLILC